MEKLCIENIFKITLDLYTKIPIMIDNLLHRPKGKAMAKMQQYTFRQMEKIVVRNGYVYVRCNGDHNIYKHKQTQVTIVLVKKKLKENNLIIK